MLLFFDARGLLWTKDQLTVALYKIGGKAAFLGNYSFADILLIFFQKEINSVRKIIPCSYLMLLRINENIFKVVNFTRCFFLTLIQGIFLHRKCSVFSTLYFFYVKCDWHVNFKARILDTFLSKNLLWISFMQVSFRINLKNNRDKQNWRK